MGLSLVPALERRRHEEPHQRSVSARGLVAPRRLFELLEIEFPIGLDERLPTTLRSGSLRPAKRRESATGSSTPGGEPASPSCATTVRSLEVWTAARDSCPTPTPTVTTNPSCGATFGGPQRTLPPTFFRGSGPRSICSTWVAGRAPSRANWPRSYTRVASLASTPPMTSSSISAPLIHGYHVESGQPAEDVSQAFAAGWSWASRGVTSTPMDTNRFIRAYGRELENNFRTRSAQFQFVGNASSEPPGPRKNASGLAIFQ